jgi:NAD(P)-dependent dehydrogenase (short-subunit alcohol dehydrogenase family)
MFEIKDKVIAITGGGGVLCGELARGLAKQGAKVAVWDLDEKAASKVAEEAGGLAVTCDVLDAKSVAKAVAASESELGPIDVLINGAGGNKQQATTGEKLPFPELSPEAVRGVFDLNFLGSFIPCQAVAGGMAKRGAGNILNISSMAALAPLTKIPAYSAAKAAVANFTRWLAVHMCQEHSKDIRVNAIAPGFFLTEQNRFLLTDEKSGELTARGKTIIEHTPMGRFGEPAELVGIVTWLLSEEAKFVTGTVIPVDGGFSAFSGV